MKGFPALQRRRKTVIALGIAAVLLLVVAVLWRPQAPAQAEPAATVALTVNLVSPRRETWPQIIHADGAVAAWQEAIISAETGSLRIVELNADVGAVVHRGDLLARLADDSAKADVQKQEAAVAEAQAALRQAQADLGRAKTVADAGSLSSQQIDQYESTEATRRAQLASAQAALQSARITLRQTRLEAVDDGIISSRSALLGNVVSPGSELFRLVRQSRVEWQAEVDSQQLPQVHEGQRTTVALPGGRKIDGKVRLASPTLSTATGRAIVYVSLPNGSGAQPGTYASGTIETGMQEALTVPESALVIRDGRIDVFVLKDDGASVTRRTIVTGRRQGGSVDVVSGLDAGARVVASGGAFLTEGATVKVVTVDASEKKS
ncbi:efflux RND transporter periplasmic adaptor subunit [Hydrocarboniphaga sp.]|uniref:efflux RND transporter periplasmic adaptor subunit n=1 Tax=Hydrocarboniphaga sp. TaxID=2033016 RepID=UPI003D0BF1DF